MVHVTDGPPDVALPSRRSALASWLFGGLVLVALITVVARRGELAEFGRLLRGLEPRWFLAAAALQILSQLIAAAVWHAIFRYAQYPCGFWTVVRIRMVMLFANEALPSAGLAGSVVAIRTLGRRGVPAGAVVSAIIGGVMTSYVAGGIAVAASIVMLRAYNQVSLRVLVSAGLVGLIFVAAFALSTWRREKIAPKLSGWLVRMPRLTAALETVGTAPIAVLRNPSLWVLALPLQFAEQLLDSGTLFVLLVAIGVRPSPAAVFGSFMMAQALTGALPLPGNFGAFEAALVTMLRLVGIQIEPALAAALLLRGFNVWLPLIPGFWFARSELPRGVSWDSIPHPR
jgi:uncharacterized protein (TIRG00374 family)